MTYRHNKIYAAVMFTDMAGYSALMHNDESEALLHRAKHKEAMRDSHARFRGEIIQYFGDGTLSLFRGVTDAIEAALYLQSVMRKDPTIPLRIGIHVGEIVRTEDDILGDSVNIASRIESFCPPGAVVFSEQVKQQLTDDKRFDVISLGKFYLKNIDAPLELFALKDDKLVVPVPGALSGKGFRLSDKSANVPRLLSSFIGREKELEDLTTLIREHRLVTISGPGGTGKTRLSIEIARRLAEDSPTRTFWVNLAALHDPEQVVFTIADTLGVDQDPQFPMIQLLVSFIGSQELIVVLDNFEQVIEAANVVEDILNSCPRVRLIVTSRVRLRLHGEVEYPVSPLKTPVTGEGQTPERALGFPSVALFVDRAGKVRPTFKLTPENVSEVIAICRRLDGLPLAIELAAARTKIFSPEALRKRIEGSLDLLSGAGTNLPTRHQTLRQTVMWSYDSLSEAEKELFIRLSVFSGSFSIEAVEQICGVDLSSRFPSSVDLIIDLVDKSLVTTMGEDVIRFYMLETIRAFAMELFQTSGSRDEVERRHVDFYLALVQKAYANLTGHGQVKWLGILESEYDNIRKALAWCYSNSEYTRAFEFGLALWRYWNNRSLLTEGLEEIQKILSLPISDETESLRLRMMEGLGVIYVNLNTFNTANDIFKETVEIWRLRDDSQQLATNLNHLGWTSINIGDFENGRRCSEEALRIHEQNGNIYGQGVAINNLAWIAFEQGWPDKAVELWRRSTELRLEAKDLRGYGFALANTAMALTDKGELEEARRLVEKAIEIHEESRSKLMMYWDYMILVNIHLACNDETACRELLDKIYENGFNLGSYNVTVNYYMFKASLLMAEKEYADADRMARHGLELGHRNGIDHCVRRILVILARNSLLAGWDEQALKWCMEGIITCNKKGDRLRQIQLMEIRAQLFFNSGDARKAMILLTLCNKEREVSKAPLSVVEARWIKEVDRAIRESLEPAELNSLSALALELDIASVLEYI